jgi:hypothetical protein
MPQECDEFSHEIDHVIAKQHRGSTTAGNLALACFQCNAHKGTNLSGLDPVDGKLTKLFHPRRHRWGRHFRWDGPYLVGRTGIGRVTVAVLAINARKRVLIREELLAEGAFPPAGS